MPSPFPGMNPYLGNPVFWAEVNNRLIVNLADSLAPQLPPQYRVAIEQRTYLSDESDSVLVGIPDVAVFSSSSALKQTSSFSPGAGQGWHGCNDTGLSFFICVSVFIAVFTPCEVHLGL